MIWRRRNLSVSPNHSDLVELRPLFLQLPSSLHCLRAVILDYNKQEKRQLYVLHGIMIGYIKIICVILADMSVKPSSLSLTDVFMPDPGK